MNAVRCGRGDNATWIHRYEYENGQAACAPRCLSNAFIRAEVRKHPAHSHPTSIFDLKV